MPRPTAPDPEAAAKPGHARADPAARIERPPNARLDSGGGDSPHRRIRPASVRRPADPDAPGGLPAQPRRSDLVASESLSTASAGLADRERLEADPAGVSVLDRRVPALRTCRRTRRRGCRRRRAGRSPSRAGTSAALLDKTAAEGPPAGRALAPTREQSARPAPRSAAPRSSRRESAEHSAKTLKPTRCAGSLWTTAYHCLATSPSPVLRPCPMHPAARWPVSGRPAMPAWTRPPPSARLPAGQRRSRGRSCDPRPRKAVASTVASMQRSRARAP